jgi:hypothetical protein
MRWDSARYSIQLRFPDSCHPRNPWSVSDPIQRFNDSTAAKQIVFIRVYSWLTFADGCG